MGKCSRDYKVRRSKDGLWFSVKNVVRQALQISSRQAIRSIHDSEKTIMCNIGVGDCDTVGFREEAAIDNDIVLLVDVDHCVDGPT